MHRSRLVALALTLALSPVVRADDAPAPLPTLWLVGDSTVLNGAGRGDDGLYGWGQVFARHVDPARARVENRARGGRSSRTYQTEGLWQGVVDALKPGDYVLVQFGHNDGGELFTGDRCRASIRGNGDETQEGVVELTGKREVVHSYGWYLRRYIADARERGATAVVLSPVPRNQWRGGAVPRADRDYGRWAAEAAAQGGALFFDLNGACAEAYERAGEPRVRGAYFYPADHTHTTLAGAEANAACVAGGLRTLGDARLAGLLLEGVDPERRAFSFAGPRPGAVGVAWGAPYDPQRGHGFEPGAAGGRFSVRLPEGNHRVRVTYPPAAGATQGATIKAELRRLMADRLALKPEGPTVVELTVNTRTPVIAGGSGAPRVRLKPRERAEEALAWDDRLTLEFLGPRPSALEVAPAADAPTLYLAGDSTVTDQPNEPWASWGQMLPYLLGPGVAVANHAESGESVAGSLGAGRFDKILHLAKPGDVLAIQFGHNDMKDQRGGALDRYRQNLAALVDRARERGLTPVLITSMERKAGVDAPTLEGYPDAVRSVAAEKGCPLVDLHATSRTLYRALGADLDAAFQDGTHHTGYGADLLARCVAQGLRAGVPELAARATDGGGGAFDPARPYPATEWGVPPSAPAAAAPPDGS